MLDKINEYGELIGGVSTFFAFVAVIVVAHYDRRASRRTQRVVERALPSPT
jgi:hypothetical protein